MVLSHSLVLKESITDTSRIADHFSVVSNEVNIEAELPPNSVLIQLHVLSADPYMLAQMKLGGMNKPGYSDACLFS